MSNNSGATKSLADVKQLLYFRVYKTEPSEQHGAIKVFGNSRQRCPIKVGVIAADTAGFPIELTENELVKALSLIHYDSGAELGSAGDEYKYSRTAGTYVWDEDIFPSTSRLGDATPAATKELSHATKVQPAANVQTFYVQASEDASDLPVAARFTVYESLFFTTNSPVDDPNGQGHNGQFNSYVTVDPVTSPILSPSDFGASSGGVLAGTKVGNSNHFYWATEYYLDPRWNGRPIPLGSAFQLYGDFGFYTRGTSSVKWGFSYYGQPGEHEVDSVAGDPLYTIELLDSRGKDQETSGLNYFPMEMFKNCVNRIESANSTRVVVGIIKGNLQATFLNDVSSEIDDRASSKLYLDDIYGNTYEVVLLYNATSDILTVG